MARSHRKLALALAISAGIAVSACSSPKDQALENTADTLENQADVVSETAENTADAIEANAANATDATQAAAENKADAVRAAGENKSDALEDQADAVRDKK